MNEIALDTFFLHPGFVFVSREPFLISTVLGSCVSICVWDEAKHFGGINHFVYSHPQKKEIGGQYGSISIPYLFHLMNGLGANKADLRVHIVGGAQNPDLNSYIGDTNVQIAEEWLETRRIKVVSRDTGGQIGRKVVFNNQTGEVWVYKIQHIRKADWYDISNF